MPASERSASYPSLRVFTRSTEKTCWMFPGRILLILFWPCSSARTASWWKVTWLTQKDIIHFSERAGWVLFVCSDSASVVLFEHCYPKSILCTPTILHPNESPQSSAHNSCLISRLFLPRKISKHGQLLLISHNMTNQKSNYNICQN